MSSRSTLAGAAALATLAGALLLRAVTVHSVAQAPLIYRTVVNANDLDGVEGLAPPGSFVELWYKQRNFTEGTDTVDDPFNWCRWKNGGTPVRLGWTWADGNGTFRLTGLRLVTTVSLFPPQAGGGTCAGGIYTELLPRACDAPGVNCSAIQAPILNWLNVKRPSSRIGEATGAVTNAEQTALAVADGPDTGTQWSDKMDVDQNAIDTTLPGFVPGQRVVWRCGAGGTAVCPSIAVYDASTPFEKDAEYPFLLGTMQAHRHGGSFFAAAAVARPDDPGWKFTVNGKFRGRLDINLGCDQAMQFHFAREFVS